MWSDIVVVITPYRQLVSGILPCFENLLIKAFITKATIEAFHKSILAAIGLSRLLKTVFVIAYSATVPPHRAREFRRT
jgi:hypothetical protein